MKVNCCFGELSGSSKVEIHRRLLGLILCINYKYNQDMKFALYAKIHVCLAMNTSVLVTLTVFIKEVTLPCALQLLKFDCRQILFRMLIYIFIHTCQLDVSKLWDMLLKKVGFH